jgi:hypothetical protein
MGLELLMTEHVRHSPFVFLLALIVMTLNVEGAVIGASH